MDGVRLLRLPPYKYPMNDTFCIYPFIGTNIRVNSELTPCCAYKDSTSRKSIDQFDEYRTVDIVKIQSDLLNGIRHSGCRTCWHEEDHNKLSYRQGGFRAYQDLIDSTDWTVAQIHPIKFLHIEFNNLCNLKCIMCSPHASSSIDTEMMQNQEAYKKFPIQNYHGPSARSDDTLEFVINNLVKNLDTLTVTGGEPFMIPQVTRLLEEIKNHSDITFCVATNATNIPSRILELLGKFKNIIITASLEGVGLHNNYVRGGSDWETVHQNIQKLTTLSNFKYGRVNIGHVLQYTSLWALGPVIEYCVKYDLDLSVRMLEGKSDLNIAQFTPQEVSVFKQKLQSISVDGSRLSVKQQIGFVLSVLDNLEDQPRLHGAHREYVKMLDGIRETDFDQVFPTVI